MENNLSVKRVRSNSLNIIVPMAGAGKRFEQAGYHLPKPLINIKNKPMIQIVIENIAIEANYIYMVQKAHYEKYDLGHLLEQITPGCRIIQIDGVTEGAACTALIAKDLINNDKELLIVNSDQWLNWDSSDFLYFVKDKMIDGVILTFKSTHPKCSFVKLNSDGNVIEVKEKIPISNMATVGIYYWKRGQEFVRYAEQMVQKNLRVNNEFYVAPVYNEAIEDKKKIKNYHVEEMWGLGTPEDLQYFLDNNKLI